MAISAQAAASKFRNNPTKLTAGAYLDALLADEAHDALGDDYFIDGLAEIRDWLQEGEREE